MKYGVPTKRSVTIAGHETSISLEPAFWAALEAATMARGLPLNALIASIDVERLGSTPPPNLTSAIRQWLFAGGGIGVSQANGDGAPTADKIVGR